LGIAFSFSALANSSETFLYDLQIGEQLNGSDFVTKEACSVDVIDRNQNGKKVDLTLEVAVGDKAYGPIKVTRRLVIHSVTLYGQQSKLINNIDYNTVTVDAYLQQGRVRGKKSFVLSRTVWGQQGYTSKNLIDCRF